MKTVIVSEFKAKCVAILREAQRSGEPIMITRRGRPLARVEPVIDDGSQRVLGLHRGRMKIHGDLVNATSEADWEMLG